ncbi:MAG TPA: hypothetical protein PLL69_02600 [Gemmatimonadales bacterium]|nr:hypothetical protein [Gemmatimonadales bacterium]
MTSGKILPGYVEVAVGAGTECVDYRVIVLAEFGGCDIAPYLDIADEAQQRVCCDPIEDPADRLDLRMIRRHPAAHQAVRSGQPVEQIHPALGEGLLDRFRGIESGRAGADDGDAKR